MENLEYWKNRFDFMMEEKRKNSYIYLGSNDEFQIKHRPNEVFNQCNLNYIVNQISLLNGITKDNIHLYYEFMSDEDLFKFSFILNDILRNRICYIHNALNIDFLEFIDDYIEYKEYNDDYIEYKCYGIKDTLKPIDDYIAEIKESGAYKEYMAKKP